MLMRQPSELDANRERWRTGKRQRRRQSVGVDEPDALRASIQNRYYNATPMHGAKACTFWTGTV
ncbi:hypothetical protein F0A17_04220 [Billgrantia pellis]|uniref:Uncharacterized protein n=1 Tax=Billgrantia pellis TaxID=2606936 RepID=A0A7V7KJ89_9GAMM|nr:hypothetical protein F0A17_04220 [Halomonas pellis]